MKLGQVAISVPDLPAAIAFHRDVLGLPYLFEVPNLAFFDLGGARLMLSSGEAAGPQEFVLYYRVDDLNAAWNDVLARGGQAAEAPHLVATMPDYEVWIAFVRAPDGKLTGLTSEVRR